MCFFHFLKVCNVILPHNFKKAWQACIPTRLLSISYQLYKSSQAGLAPTLTQFHSNSLSDLGYRLLEVLIGSDEVIDGLQSVDDGRVVPAPKVQPD